MHEELEGRADVAIYALNSGADSRAEVAAVWAEEAFGFPPLLDPPGSRGAMARGFGVAAYPTNIVIDPQGVVLHASVGFDEPTIRKLLGL